MNYYEAEIDVIIVYPHAWCDVSYLKGKEFIVYSDDRIPMEYDCILGRGETENKAWSNAKKNLNKKLCKRGE